ncbi:hypothetical protein BO82DRAFT_48768 [Aspergillus uvarum CBS 121591]|uniref:Uncharacterized protein n=1 Tax=Aspergillus uvarum CBS 121591 TaxID=1448315 RepID=A0A319CGN6_9EURO|nr:hypothetical protein BO82DRAFT_48768 [Aspergillus uvarum CBS 121591]PYH82961.1 hypothetical protein BO82DRAFT_48768 [Aspergillus uvarum CBS 121591]
MRAMPISSCLSSSDAELLVPWKDASTHLRIPEARRRLLPQVYKKWNANTDEVDSAHCRSMTCDTQSRADSLWNLKRIKNTRSCLLFPTGPSPSTCKQGNGRREVKEKKLYSVKCQDLINLFIKFHRLCFPVEKSRRPRNRGKENSGHGNPKASGWNWC